ncbi:MBL fold metallo-hydrolase [Chelatococcus sp. SYSU_G07232]|uniref:MBL fold metallo-hydrolase n=1 Tax=Chelatococcus albus TaxID=3047466 RepID=A0ABT7AEC8_9HYPH|nr:MBL fold metallo-hydrolase [Chelatococcus sp. SYSU_G07232]MDJ1157726.1 MBL fold metallo-hydrolase [Chelatococcus sp. SYSU_G07232]
MAEDIPFERDFAAEPGAVVVLTPLVRRVLVPNPGPFTYTGTCTYIIGRGTVAILDPGPDDGAHVAAILDAVRGETVSHVVVTHTHRDHSPAAGVVKTATGAMIAGCAPHHPARPLALGEINPLDASADRDYAPDLVLDDGEAVTGPGWSLAAVATPGHTANHLAFALPEENALFSGDHVMAWSTSIVAPPDGSMADYMASLDRLRGRGEAVYWPGHGGPVREPQRFVRALLGHRRQREAAILARLAAGDETIAAIVPRLYEGLAPALHGAAALSVFAHLEDLVARGLVVADGPPALDGRFRLA